MAAVSLNTAILITTYALMDGMIIHMVSNATNLVVGEAQIHAPKYLVNRSMYNVIDDPDSIIEQLERKGLKAAARSYGYGLAARETKSAGALFWGVDPGAESRAFKLSGAVEFGGWLKSGAENGVVLGKKLARSLKAEVGSEIVVVVQAADGSLGNELFYVTGILKTAGDSIDRTAAILHKSDFEELFVSGGRIHEIAINSSNNVSLNALKEIAEKAGPNEEVKTWRQLMQSLSDMVSLNKVAVWLFGMIFFLAAGLGVMNTTLMATFERFREFGILKAIGATPWRIMRDVSAEAVVLVVVSTAVGTIIGLIGSFYFQEFGLDTSSFAGSFTVAGVAFDPVWRASISMGGVFYPVIVMWLVSFLAALYPAAIAARLDPVKAIHHV